MKKQPGKPVTLAHIAAAAGVTPMTVSRVINESGYVNAATRERVRRVAREMNYRRNGLARGLKRQRTETIGLVLGDIANPFAAELSRGVREILEQRRSEEHTSELQSQSNLVCRLLLEKKKNKQIHRTVEPM